MVGTSSSKLNALDETCSLMESEMSSRFPLAVALSEKFLWEVFLTDKWHNCLIRNSSGVDYFLYELSFCPTQRYWRDDRQVSGDDKIIVYAEPNNSSTVIVGMRKEYAGEQELWYPNSISMDVLILKKRLNFSGDARFLSSPTKVRF